MDILYSAATVDSFIFVVDEMAGKKVNDLYENNTVPIRDRARGIWSEMFVVVDKLLLLLILPIFLLPLRDKFGTQQFSNKDRTDYKLIVISDLCSSQSKHYL